MAAAGLTTSGLGAWVNSKMSGKMLSRAMGTALLLSVPLILMNAGKQQGGATLQQQQAEKETAAAAPAAPATPAAPAAAPAAPAAARAAAAAAFFATAFVTMVFLRRQLAPGAFLCADSAHLLACSHRRYPGPAEAAGLCAPNP